MGRSIHSVDCLHAPLSLVDERLMDIPAGMDLCFSNRIFKVLLFLEADHELILGDQAPVPVRGGDLLFLPLRIRQTYRAVRRNSPSRIHAVRLILNLPLLSPDSSGKSPGRGRLSAQKDMRTFIAGSLRGFRRLPGFITARVQEQLRLLRQEAEARRLGYRFAVSQICFSLILEAIRQASPEEPAGRNPPMTKSIAAIERTKEFLVENLAEPLTLDQIAWHVRLSREHLARLFRQITGQTVFQYLSQLRLEAAQTHLCNPNLLIGEVARRSGFSSLPLFCRTFRKAIKVTPVEYRMERMSEVRFSPSTYSRSPF